MKSILVLVTSSPFASANCHSALAFCEAACRNECKIEVFFYGDGVHNANAFIAPASDEKNIMKQWQELAKQYEVQLIVCNTAASKRGIVSEEEAQFDNAFNLHLPFIAGGLAEFASLSQSTDRLIQF